MRSGGSRSKVRPGRVPAPQNLRLALAADQVTRLRRIARESVALVAETLTGRLIDLDGEVFHLETDQGERIEVTIEGPHEHATATRVGPIWQHHEMGPPSRGQ